MTKEEILDYVMSTPDNTNRRVLSDMIDQLINTPSGGGDDGVFYIHFVYDDTAGEGEPYMYTVETAGEIYNAGLVDGKTLVATGFTASSDIHPVGAFDDFGAALIIYEIGVAINESVAKLQVQSWRSVDQTDPTKPFAFIDLDQVYTAELTPME